jgi:hypothetical protein
MMAVRTADVSEPEYEDSHAAVVFTSYHGASDLVKNIPQITKRLPGPVRAVQPCVHMVFYDARRRECSCPHSLTATLMDAMKKRELKFEDCGLFSIYIQTNDNTYMKEIVNSFYAPTLAMSQPSSSLASGMRPVIVVLNWTPVLCSLQMMLSHYGYTDFLNTMSNPQFVRVLIFVKSHERYPPKILTGTLTLT